MTEHQFRDGLKKSVGHIGFSSECQMKVLARMKEGERKARTWSSMKIALAAGIVLLLMTGVTGAIAGGWRMLDWSGKPLQNQRVASDQRMLELMDKYSNGQAVSVLKWNEEAGDYRGVLAASVDLNVYSFEKLQSLVTADGTLPWPVNIPEEYQQLIQGEVRYSCKAEGEFRLRKQEVTEDGYIISCFLLPNASRFMEGYTLYLRDENRQQLSIWLQLAQKQGVYGMPAEDGSTFTELKVDGMLQAVAIESAEKTRVALRQEVRSPLQYKVVKALPDGVIEESKMEYDCLELQIAGQGTPAELLAIFGLTAQ